MDYTEILYEKQRNGVLITFNRPQAMNAISRTILREMHRALDEAEADPEIRAVDFWLCFVRGGMHFPKLIRKSAPWFSPARDARFPQAWIKGAEVRGDKTSSGPTVC